MLALILRDGPPAHLVVSTNSAEGLILNSVRPVHLPMRLLDSEGHELEPDGVRYVWTSGTPMAVSPSGAVTCRRPGGATVRASLGQLAISFRVRCHPVREIRATIYNDFLVGDPARELPAEFIGVDGRPVTVLTGELGIDDNSVAVLDAFNIRPVSAGRAHLRLRVGNQSTSALVRVFSPVNTLVGLRPAERHVAALVNLSPGATIQWPLPEGLFSMAFLPDHSAAVQLPAPAPTITVQGPVMCLPTPSPTVYDSWCLVRGPGATVTVAHPGNTVLRVVGALALERDPKP